MEKHKIIIVGGSGSGKTYLKNGLINLGLKGDVSFTTREPRPGEVDGVDYWFISKEQAEHLINNGQVVQWQQYNQHYYGTTLDSWNCSSVFIMNAKGVLSLQLRYFSEAMVIHLDIDESIRAERLGERGTSKEEVESRLIADRLAREQIVGFSHMTITDPNFDIPPIGVYGGKKKYSRTFNTGEQGITANPRVVPHQNTTVSLAQLTQVLDEAKRRWPGESTAEICRFIVDKVESRRSGVGATSTGGA